MFHFNADRFNHDKMKLFLNCVSLIHALPTVIWHGMGDYGESSGMQRMAQLVKDNTDNDYVLNLVIGNSKFASSLACTHLSIKPHRRIVVMAF